MVLFTVLLVVQLSVVMVVVNYLCPSSSSVVRMTSPLHVLENNPPNPASVVDYMTFLIILEIVRIVRLYILGFGELGLFPKYKLSPTQLLSCGAEIYNTSLWM